MSDYRDSRILGLLEFLASQGTGAIAGLGGGLSYIPAAIAGGHKAGSAVSGAVNEAIRYQPTTVPGQALNYAAGQSYGVIGDAINKAGMAGANALSSATGSPEAGGLLSAVVAAGGEKIGGKRQTKAASGALNSGHVMSISEKKASELLGGELPRSNESVLAKGDIGDGLWIDKSHGGYWLTSSVPTKMWKSLFDIDGP